MQDQFQAIATLFSLINPVMCVAMFLGATTGMTFGQKMSSATRAVLTVALILVIAALAGASILRIFGVSLEAFSVAGGGVLAFIGFSMLSGRSATSTPEPEAHEPASTGSNKLAPLIIFAASPGTITGVITIATGHSGTGLPVTALIGIGIVLAIVWILLILGSRAGASGKPPSFTQQMITRFMGLIVIAMGIQFILTGITTFVPTAS